MAEEKYSSATDETENKDSSQTSSLLSLPYLSSPFLSHNSFSDNNEDSHSVEPYLYEPEDSSSDAASESSDDSQIERLGNTEW